MISPRAANVCGPPPRRQVHHQTFRPPSTAHTTRRCPRRFKRLNYYSPVGCAGERETRPQSSVPDPALSEKGTQQ